MKYWMFIKDLAKSGMTMVIVTHEMAFARRVASRVIFIDEGIIKEQNAPEEFFAHPKDPRLAGFPFQSADLMKEKTR